MTYEVNFDGIVGPTHNYSGLSFGNVASISHKESVSNPKEAALQGLKKMKFLADLGIKQAVLPPHERPHIPTLQALGYSGTDAEIINQASTNNLELYLACCSAAAMWTANAGIVTPSSDAIDRKVHFTPANLCSKFHRSIETETTSKILQTIFNDPNYFTHHMPISSGSYFSDEGAANHTRFCKEDQGKGVHLFVYGRKGFGSLQTPKKFPARQTLEAFQAIAMRHQIPGDQVIFAQQNPDAIDGGVFHNDVISVGNRNLFFYHELAFVDTEAVIEQIKERVKGVCQTEMHFIKVGVEDISLENAVSSYLFNSQIVTSPNERTLLFAPTECREIPSVKDFLEKMIPVHGIQEIHYLPLHESMRNGGGPACLRFRVVLSEAELAATNPHVFMDDVLYEKLTRWVEKHYRYKLAPKDLADPQLLLETRAALDELTRILHLGNVYSFQV